MQDEKQQQDNQAANNQNNQQAAQADKEMERGLAMESEKMTKEKEELCKRLIYQIIILIMKIKKIF